MKLFLRVALSSLVLFALLLSHTLAAEIKIGLMCPLTGSYAGEGQDMQKVVELLAEELNKSGGINGDTVKIITEDDGSDPRNATLAAQRLSESGATAVIGTYGSAITQATQGIYDEAGMVQIATGSTSVQLTDRGYRMFFRTSPRDDDQGRFMANAIGKLGLKKVAILHDNSAYAKGLAAEVLRFLKDNKDLEVIFYEAIKPKEQDYTAALTKLKGANPDLLVFTGYYVEAGMLLRQMRDMKWQLPVLGGDATNNEALIKIAGKEAAAGYRMISPPLPGDLDSDEAVAFLNAYKEKNGKMPSSIWSLTAGDAFRIIVEAIKVKGSTAKEIAGYLHKDLKDFAGFTGPISFDAKGDRIGDIYSLYIVSPEGAFVRQ